MDFSDGWINLKATQFYALELILSVCLPQTASLEQSRELFRRTLSQEASSKHSKQRFWGKKAKMKYYSEKKVTFQSRCFFDFGYIAITLLY